MRLSGPHLARFAQALLGQTLQPRHATYLPFADATGHPIDHGLALFFPAPHSFTGEDVLELQAHGGPVVLQLLVARCLELASQPTTPPTTQSATQAVAPSAAPSVAPATTQPPTPVLAGLRLAQPGEFSQRAFLNNKLDLTQAEAIADLIDASTEAAAKSASRSLAGGFSKEVGVLRDALVDVRMLLEATLDFPEEDVDVVHHDRARAALDALQAHLAQVLQRATQGALLRDGIRVVIAGQPNAGKSSLLNALAGVELAIVTPIAGTTRDRVEQTIQVEGVALHVVDTAGLREAADEVERLGIARAWEAIGDADVVLLLHDLTRCDDAKYAADDAQIESDVGLDARKIHVWNKCDVCPPQALRHVAHDDLAISAKAGLGLEALRKRLLDAVGWQSTAENVFMARQRHVQALQSVGLHLCNAQQWLNLPSLHLDLIAEELRLAQLSLSSITGTFSPDDLLGEIFSRFCIGK